MRSPSDSTRGATPGSSDDEKPAVAVYTRIFLPISMTFVYRQLLGVVPEFRAIALATSLENAEVFSFRPIFIREKRFPDRLYSRMASALSRGYHVESPLQLGYWQRVLVDNNVRLVHAHFGPHGLDMLPVVRGLGIPLLVSFHGYDASRLLRDARYVRALGDLFAYADIIAASRDHYDALMQVGADPQRSRVHYIGVPVDTFTRVEREPPASKVASRKTVTFLQVSNFVEKKGHRYTVEAFARLADGDADVHLVLAGDGPLRPGVEALCRAKGIEARVRFVGKVTTREVVDLMREADVFVHHSVTAEDGDKEGTTTVIAEAMATGLPVIATWHGGIPEMIEDGVNGFLVRERDVASYAARMEQALALDGAMGARASERIRTHFDITAQNAALRGIYGEIIQDERRRAAGAAPDRVPTRFGP